jgi:hypothetical protein
LTQFVSPDDERNVLETCRELKIEINTYKRVVRHVGHLPRIITEGIKLTGFGTNYLRSFPVTNTNFPFHPHGPD